MQLGGEFSNAAGKALGSQSFVTNSPALTLPVELELATLLASLNAQTTLLY